MVGSSDNFFQAFMLSIVGKTIIEYARSTDGSNGKSTKREPHLTRAETKVETSASLRRRNASSVSRKDVPADGVCNAFVPARTETASASSASSEEIPNRLPSWYMR